VSRSGFDGKVVVVTGSSRGLGRALALGYAEAGADVVVTARRGEALKEICGEIEALGRAALPVAADLGAAAGCEALAERALAFRGHVDVLVNNAGISEPRPFLEDDDEHWQRVMAVNLQSAVRLSRRLGAAMLARGSGNILMLGSVLGRTAMPGNASYFVSKAAIEQLARALALEWSRKGVRVNCLAPGFFGTELVDDANEEGPFRNYVLRRTPMRRLGEPSELVDAALYLTSDAASFVTGTTLNVDGGWLAG
jgi:NAD(P)-dependent dehydrogenase (short-subunit alcohol dehydrogenase family)